MRLISLALCTALLTISGGTTAVAASTATYSFTGVVTASHGGPKPGQTVAITFTVNRDFAADAGGTPGMRASYTGGSASPSGLSPILGGTIDKADAHGWFDSIKVQKNLGGVSAVTMSTALPQYGLSLTVAMATAMHGVVKSLAIPASVFPGLFQSATFTVYVSPRESYAGVLR